MPLSVSTAYQRIKALEDTDLFALPRVQETITVGTIDPKAGTFTWTLPTVQRTTTIPPTPPGRINTIITKEVGVVHTEAVDLRLRFDVIPQRRPGTMDPEIVRDAEVERQPGRGDSLSGRVLVSRRVALHQLHTLTFADGLFVETNGGVTITGFPTVESVADHPPVSG